MSVESALWRRLHGDGHDACHLVAIADGWLLEGRAVFAHEGAPAQLAYQVACDREWRSVSGQITGWLGHQPVERSLAQTAPGVWTLDDEAVPGLGDCVDLDFSITPATNVLQLRRLALAVGQSADVPVAWLDVEAGRLARLPQHYERRSATEVAYEAPTLRFSTVLEVAPNGFVRRYPPLWEAAT